MKLFYHSWTTKISAGKIKARLKERIIIGLTWYFNTQAARLKKSWCIIYGNYHLLDLARVYLHRHLPHPFRTVVKFTWKLSLIWLVKTISHRRSLQSKCTCLSWDALLSAWLESTFFHTGRNIRITLDNKVKTSLTLEFSFL